MKFRIPAVVVCTILIAAWAGRSDAQCIGDCSGNSTVDTSELVTCVNIGLGTKPLGDCVECSSDGENVHVTDLVDAVANSIEGCEPVDTPTPTQPVATPTPTPTGTQVCPLSEGQYTLTQTSGGQLTVDDLPAFPFPSDGTIILDLGPGEFPECTHQATIAFPGGFNAPVFCIPALGFTTSVVQTGCGVGELDSNGGSDYTVSEVGDTSDSSTVCDIPQTGTNCIAGTDAKVRVDITLGDGEADRCESGGSANLITTVPVFTTTWQKIGFCPDPDGTYDPGTDTLIVSFPQTLDFTSDTTSADFADIDGDECCIAGAGPSSVSPADCTPGTGPGPLVGNGTCIDLGVGTATTAASGPIGSSGSPLFDLSFLTILPNRFESTGEFQGTTCENPPVIPIGEEPGTTQTRCVR